MKLLSEFYTTAFAEQTRIKLGLETISKLDLALGAPSTQFRSIHVGGTNGKGSVTTKISYALKYAGYKVGRYTSPHIRAFHERIWVDGRLISDEKLIAYVDEVGTLLKKEGIQATFFEITTLVAFLFFAREKVDFAVIEVGMGGRLDATNIISPLLSIITSIDYDHKEHLGDTLEKIAYEKGGIIKKETPVVLGASIAPLFVLQKIAHEHHAPLYIAPQGEDFEKQNQNTAALALSCLFPSLPKQVVDLALAMKPPCRFQLVRTTPPLILDVAHNKAGIVALFHKLEREFPGQEIIVVAAFSSEEKAREMIDFMNSKVSMLYVTKANHERGIAPPPIDGVESVATVGQALGKANQQALARGALLVVTGTFFMMEEVFSFFEKSEQKGLDCDWASLSN